MIRISVTILPALYALQETMYRIWSEEGEQVAVEWFEKTLSNDSGLFIRLTDPRPKLTVIPGGAL